MDYVHKLVVLEDGQLAALASNEKFTREFPFLRNLNTVRQGGGCRKCGTNNRQRSTNYQAAKMAVAGMGGAQKLKLKQMLKAKQVRVLYIKPNRQVVSLTF